MDQQEADDKHYRAGYAAAGVGGAGVAAFAGARRGAALFLLLAPAGAFLTALRVFRLAVVLAEDAAAARLAAFLALAQRAF